jgi:hypothetical protein
MKVESFVSLVVSLLFSTISNAATVTRIYEDEIIDHSHYEIVQVYDSLDVPPEQTTVIFVADSGAMEIHSNDTSIVNIYGGTFGTLGLLDSSTMNLYGGQINTVLGSSAASTLNVFGTHFSILTGDPHASLSGTWENGSDFSFIFYRMPEIPDNVVLHEIPEPATVLLLLSGILINRIRIQRS